jgi:hypothetical protein
MSRGVGRSRVRRLLTGLGLSLTLMTSGCDFASAKARLKTPDIPDISELPDLDDLDDVDVLERQALTLLALLFPDLSEEELIELKGSLSLEAVISLRAELEAARAAAAAFGDALFTSASERVEQRRRDLTPHNGGFPVGLAAVASHCSYDARQRRGHVQLSGVFDGKQALQLSATDVHLSIDGVAQTSTLRCLHAGSSVDIVFLIDITGSMSNVIHAVRDSVVNFIDLLEQSGVRGTVAVVTFQDSVGVNVSFQQPAPANDYERSPFFAPVSLDDPERVDALRAFVNRLEANRGADAPENLSGAIDFARNSVIGYAADGTANVIGDGKEDPAGTQPFPRLQSQQQVFVALTDITFHGDGQTERSSSLARAFIPRDAEDILSTLHESGTTVHVSDPSWSDQPLEPGAEQVDADYWAIHTGGVGKDVVEGYSLVDLELVVVAEDTGLLDITLDKIVASSCTLDFEAELAASAALSVSFDVSGKQFSSPVDVARY